MTFSPGRQSAHPLGLLDRPEAARLLRMARAAARRDDADFVIGWAGAAMPESRHIRRLQIDAQLQQGHVDQADVLLAAGLLERPNDAALLLRRARSLFLQGRFAEALTVAHETVRRRPCWRRPLLLAAEIAGTLGDQRQQVQLLEQAFDVNPTKVEVSLLLVQAHLDHGDVDEAARVLAATPAAPVALLARVLRRQQRLLEARHLLEAACGNAEHGNECESLWIELIEVLEEMGDLPRLRTLAEKLPADEPGARLRASEALLALGAAQQAELMLRQLPDHGPQRGAVLRALAATAVSSGTAGQAAAAFEQLERGAARVDPEKMADLLLGGMSGRLMEEHGNARRVGADPSLSVLQPLLANAVAVFDHALGAAEQKHAQAPHVAELARLRAVCQAALID